MKQKNRKTLLLAAILLLCNFTSVSIAETLVLTAKPDSPQDTRYEYPELVLKRILEVTHESHGPARMQHAEVTMSRDRTLDELVDGQNIHLTVEAAKPDWVNNLLPVYIPVRKGVQGYRIFLIHRDSQTQLSGVTNLEQLKQIPTGAGSQWSTAKVMRDEGFNLVTGPKFDGLFWMLMGDRFRTFGRGINEAPLELASREKLFPNMVIEKSLGLYLPLPTFFFVSPAHPQLAQRIGEGLKIMIADGSLDDIFYAYHLEMIESAALSQRRIFPVRNNTLPKEVPLNTQEYWFKPGDEALYRARKNLVGQR